jgi:putative ABC transport system permease protein
LRLNDLLCVSVRQVVRHRRRYLGVVLAIALGVAGLITVVTMSREVKRNFNEDLDLIGGVTVIRLYFDNKKAYQPQWFRENTLAALNHLPGVKEISLAAVKGGRTIHHGRNHIFMAVAVDDTFWRVRSFWAQRGRLFGVSELSEHQRVCVLGAELATKVFGTQDVVGRSLEINQEFYRVSGILGGVTDGDLANAAFLPLTTAQDRLPGPVLADRLYLRCLTWDDVAQVAAVLPKVIGSHQSPEELHVEVSWEGLKRVQKLAWWIEFLVYLAISATFILGGVGIWNVMMAAVTSRTREIGLKKAMGAEDKDILAQFLSEALCLSAAAALLGTGLGRIMMEIMGAMIGSRPQEDLFFLSFCLAFAFAVILGVGAGLYPSLRASRMEVVSAIRYE